MLKETLSSVLTVLLALFVVCCVFIDAEGTVLKTDTLGAVAIYASGPNTADTLLPYYYADIFDPSDPNSLSRYLKETSFQQFGLNAFATGQNTQSCFVASVEPPKSHYEGDSLGAFTVDILAAADSIIDFRQFDLTGPQNRPDNYVDMVFLMIYPYGQGHGVADLTISLYGNIFVTNDTSDTGEPIKIKTGTTNWIGSSCHMGVGPS